MVPRPLFYVFLPTELISGVKLGLGSLPGVKKGDFLIFSNFFRQFLPNPSLTAPPYLHPIGPKFLVHVAWWYGYCWWDFQEPNSTIRALGGLDVDGKMPIFANQRWYSKMKPYRPTCLLLSYLPLEKNGSKTPILCIFAHWVDFRGQIGARKPPGGEKRGFFDFFQFFSPISAKPITDSPPLSSSDWAEISCACSLMVWLLLMGFSRA